jgi:nucleoside-diphosphate-sugar epimerase
MQINLIKWQPLRRNKRNMRIFVTGGTGFIGKNLVKKLEARKHKSCLLNSNLDEVEKWQKEIIDFKPDAVCRLAWEGLTDYGSKMSIKNLNYGLNLIDFLGRTSCKTILIAGSSWEILS